MTAQEIRGERRVAREHVVARVRGHVTIEVWIVAEEFVRDTAPNDRTGRIRSLVVIISAHIRPGAFLLEVIDFLKVDQNRHAQLRCEGVHTPDSGPSAARWYFISPNPLAPDFTLWVSASTLSGVDGSALQNHVNRPGAAVCNVRT